jgi:ABC-2 type transport system permease protein
LVNLVQNENMKIYRRLRTWIMIGLMVAFVLLFSILAWHYDGKELQGDEWRVQLEESKAHYTKEINNPDLPEEIKKSFQEELKVINHRLDNDIRPAGGTMWEGINIAAEFVIIITLFTVIIAGDSLAGEFSTGTIKMLLIRPASRTRIMVSKYISTILFGILLLFILFISSFLINGILYQFSAWNLPYLTLSDSGQIIEGSMVANLWKTYLLNGVSTIMFVTMAFMISAAFRSSAMAIGFSIFALFAGGIATGALQMFDWAKYLLFSNIDLTQHLDGRPYQEGMTLGFSISVLAAYFIVFNLVAWLVFTRRDVAA